MPAERATTAIVWFRRDLRLADHPALWSAVSRFDRVLPLFVWDQRLFKPSGAARLGFMGDCVQSLSDSLDGELVIRVGHPAQVVAEVAEEAGATEVLVTADFGPYGKARDGQVAAALPDPIGMVSMDSPYAVTPGSLCTSSGTPFQVFSPFARAWREHGWAEPRPQSPLSKVGRFGLPDVAVPPEVSASRSSAFPAGEAAAHRRLDDFLERDVHRYRDDRDRPDLDATSRLSPYLKAGCVHPRQILGRLKPGDAGADSFRDELCWREFFADVLFHHAGAARHPYRPDWEHFEVDTGPAADELFHAWTQGRTGYPIIDAGMRQLLNQGWVPNRVRMISASFLIKDLHLDWRRGASWFMRHLIDGDLASNQMNWQWVAGSGTDAAPFFRIFNPITQSRKFDPEGQYIRRWVPELRRMGPREVHDPWHSGDPSPYPRPVVDHDVERRVALARFDHLRGM